MYGLEDSTNTLESVYKLKSKVIQINEIENYDLVITSYDLLKRDIEVVEKAQKKEAEAKKKDDKKNKEIMEI